MERPAVGTKVARSDSRPRADQGPMPPLWRESLWPLDWLALRLSPVYYGAGVPRGDGSAVVLVPGFMGTDLYLSELYLWLRRIGYRPYMSGIGLNAECPDRLVQRLLLTIERARTESGKPVRLIGHSLGGLIGRSACLQRPELVSQLIYLGSPLRALQAHPAVLAAVAMVRLAVQFGGPEHDGRCLTGRCSCGFGQSLARTLPASVGHTAVYSRRDGVVDWHDSLESDPRLNYEVGGTHVGLVFNHRAYEVLAQLLARSSADEAHGGGPALHRQPRKCHRSDRVCRSDLSC